MTLYRSRGKKGGGAVCQAQQNWISLVWGADDTYKVSSLQLPQAMILWKVEIKSWRK